MRGFCTILLSSALLIPAQVSANVLEGVSPDPVAELNALYTKICQWEDGETIPVEDVNINHDGVSDYLLTYDLSCRGQKSAFAGTAGMARQIWISMPDNTWKRVMDVNARDLKIEDRNGTKTVILQHQGSYCMTADAAPCFLTVELKDNEFVWAEKQHPTMDTRLKEMQKGTEQ
jgi:hypothetical protein